MPVFLRELRRDGQVDRAMAVARGAVRERPDWWMPVLYMRLADGRIYDPSGGDIVHASFAGRVQPPPAPMRPPDVSNFIGREAEIAYYSGILGSAHVAVIAGMPGVGKTTLAARLAQKIGASHDRIFWHQFHKGEGIEAIIWRLAGMLWRHGQPALWELLEGARKGGGQPPPAEVLLDYLVQILHGQGYVLCLDDFHYAEDDPIVEKAMDRLQTLLAEGAIDLIVTSRRMPTVLRTLSFEPLSGLSLADTSQLLGARKVPLEPDLLVELHQRTGGNAELLILATQALQRSRQPAQVIRRLADEDDIESFLLYELDRGLTTDEKLVMSGVAALLGYPGTRSAIEATVAGGSIKRTLRYLANRFLLMEREGELDREYLQHAIVQSFYYELLDRRGRQELHRRAAEYYEHEECDALRAALHYQCAGEHDRTIELAALNARALLGRGHGHKLRMLLEGVGTLALPPRQRAQMHVTLGEVKAFQGETEAARVHFDQAIESLAREPSDAQVNRLLARAFLGMATALEYEDPSAAIGWVDRGLAAIEETDKVLRAELLNRLGSLSIGAGECGRAVTALDEALALLSHSEPSQLRASILINLSVAYSAQQDSVASEAWSRAALALSEALHDQYALLTLRSNIGVDKYVRGDWQGAAADYEHALALAQQVGSQPEQARIHILMGTMAMHQGRAEAEMHFQYALATARQANLREHLAATLPAWAQWLMDRQRLTEAEGALREAEQLVQAHGWDYMLPEILSGMALLALDRDQPEAALEQVEQSIALAQQAGAVIEEGKGLRIKGQAQLSLGRLADAQASLEGSLALLGGADPYEAACTQVCLARVMAATGDGGRSAALLDEASALFEQLGVDHLSLWVLPALGGKERE
jgi:tetratricopeptide (TPR) repeat protein